MHVLQLPAKLYTAGVLIFIITSLDIYLGRNEVLPVAPVGLCLFLLLTLTGYIFSREIALYSLMSKTIYVYHHNVSVIVPFIIIVILSLVFSFLPTANWEDNGKFVFLPLYDFILFSLGMTLPLISFFRNRWREHFLIAFTVLLVSIGVDLIYPGFFSRLESRAAGFAVGPNASAFFVIILCSIIVRYDKVRLLDILVIILAGAGIFGTLSRGGILLYSLFLIIYFFCSFVKSDLKDRAVLIFLSLISAIILALVFSLIIQKSHIFEIYSARLRLSSLTSDTDFYQSDDSRIIAFEKYVVLIADAPFLGYGTGYSYSLEMGPHNMYLKQWLENGVFGFLSYISLLAGGCWIFYKRKFREGQTFMFIMIAQGVFSHNILNQRPFLLVFGILLSVSLYEYNPNLKQLKQYSKFVD